MPEQFVISAGLATRLLDYLGQRPYVEVAQLIAELLRLPPVSEPEQPKEKEEK